jgi:hypothetical protein
LMEKCRENFDKCKLKAHSSYTDATTLNNVTQKCIKTYKEDLEKIKDEIEYLYQGYGKNFDTLLDGNNTTKINEEPKI